MVFRLTLFAFGAFALIYSAPASPPHRVRKLAPKETGVARSAQAARPAPEIQDAYTDEERRYEAAKESAKTEPAIQALKEKCDLASGAEEAREASIIYYRTLFQKIREMDPSLTDRANQAELAIGRRLKE
jgi:hypothetical protein